MPHPLDDLIGIERLKRCKVLEQAAASILFDDTPLLVTDRGAILEIGRLRPVDVDGRVPVQLLAELVELVDAIVLNPVVPVVGNTVDQRTDGDRRYD